MQTLRAVYQRFSGRALSLLLHEDVYICPGTVEALHNLRGISVYHLGRTLLVLPLFLHQAFVS